MKKSGQKKYFISAWLFLAFAALFILISVTMAAYTSKASVKRVVSTKGSSGAMFSSNYLSQTTLFKSVSFISTETAPTVVVNVCNYAQGDKTKHYEDSDISYTLEAVLTDVDGQPLSAEAYDESSFDNFSVTLGGSKLKFTADESGNFSLSFGSVLSKDYVSTDSYSVSFDAAQLENPTVYVKLTATAESAVSGVSKLSGVLGVTKHSAAQSVSWTGSFTDNFAIYSNKYDSRDFDAFNYAVSGSGSGKFTLVWNTEYVEISDWFLESITDSITESSDGSITFGVDSAEINSYALQFYRVQPADENADGWDETAKRWESETWNKDKNTVGVTSGGEFVPFVTYKFVPDDTSSAESENSDNP